MYRPIVLTALIIFDSTISTISLSIARSRYALTCDCLAKSSFLKKVKITESNSFSRVSTITMFDEENQGRYIDKLEEAGDSVNILKKIFPNGPHEYDWLSADAINALASRKKPSSTSTSNDSTVYDNISTETKPSVKRDSPKQSAKSINFPNFSLDSLPNLWMVVGHASSLKPGKILKISLDGIPISIWKTSGGELRAISDICIHRGATLSKGWLNGDNIVCPYHGFEFDGHGTLKHMPGLEKCSKKARKSPSYLVKERGGWIYLFPDSDVPSAVEQFENPFSAPEASDSSFRCVEGSIEIQGDVAACMENMLDLLHISYVHSFGNLNNPVPFDVAYEHSFDDINQSLSSTKVSFHYKSGPRSFSNVVGRSEEILVTNEFHLPYNAIIRVFFGNQFVKTIHAAVLPIGNGKTIVHWKLYRNFFITHVSDQGPINRMADWMVKKMMEITLKEDKDIIEAVYPEYQQGLMNAKFDKQGIYWRKALSKFQRNVQERESMQSESNLLVELFNSISNTNRGQDTTSTERLAIQKTISSLENIYAEKSVHKTTGETSGTCSSPKVTVEGEWHLQYMFKFLPESEVMQLENTVVEDCDADDFNVKKNRGVLQEAGGEAYLLDWKEAGRPLWADTEQSVQIINSDEGMITNKAIYTGWSGLRTTVELDGVFQACTTISNRIDIEFVRAKVDVGGLKVSFPHLSRFSPKGWLDNIYVNEFIRIARGNKGSIFVLTRSPSIYGIPKNL